MAGKKFAEDLNPADERTEQEYPQITCTKFIVQRAAIAEDAHDLPGEKLKQEKRARGNGGYNGGSSQKGFSDTPVIPCAVIVSKHGLAALADSAD